MLSFTVSMIENIENKSNPVQRIFRNPTYIGVRMLFAGIAFGGITGCDSISSPSIPGSTRLNPSCPTTIAEVVYQTGGNPQNWKEIEGIKNAWIFESPESATLSTPQVGRLDTENQGQLIRNMLYERRDVKKAWYVCVESLEKPNNTLSNLLPVPVPNTPLP